MRIAALSQVPGSLGVLDAVLTDVTAQQVDATSTWVICCRARFSRGRRADGLLGLGLPTVSGNHERQLLPLPRERMGLGPIRA
jgi:hypothetical protein